MFYWIDKCDNGNLVRLNSGCSERLQLQEVIFSHSQKQLKKEQEFSLSLQIFGEYNPIGNLYVHRTKCECVMLYSDRGKRVCRLLIDTRLEHGRKIITIRSPICFRNDTMIPLMIRVSQTRKGDSQCKFDIIGPVNGNGGIIPFPLNVIS